MSTFVLPALAGLPAVPERRLAIHVTPAAERAVRQGHPWLFASGVARQSFAAAPGTVAVLFDRKGRFLAAGLYDPGSPIRVRLLQHGKPASLDQVWYRQRIGAAVERRAGLLHGQTTACRLVHGENDGLPGLVVDRYGGTLVVKLYSVGWVRQLPALLPALLQTVPAERLVLRHNRAVAQQPEALFGLGDGQVLWGPPLSGPVPFRENGLRFEADVARGHKTGFFLDQRENRMRVAGLARGGPVLDLFAYSGGFSLYAARAGASSVLSVDQSRQALALAARHFRLNGQVEGVARCRHERWASDAFAALAQLQAAGRRFDLVIADPPSFAGRAGQAQKAVASYRRLAQGAASLLAPGGCLVMASCSGQVPAESFFAAVRQGAEAAGRPLQEIERTGHPVDHPIGFPQGAYLKCLFARLAPA